MGGFDVAFRHRHLLRGRATLELGQFGLFLRDVALYFFELAPVVSVGDFRKRLPAMYLLAFLDVDFFHHAVHLSADIRVPIGKDLEFASDFKREGQENREGGDGGQPPEGSPSAAGAASNVEDGANDRSRFFE